MRFRRDPHKRANLPFSNGESFRLCTEALQALERFERNKRTVELELAERELGECVRRYPADMLPKFYLGSVKTLVGYRGLGEAIALLSDVIENGPLDLKSKAQYNLAVAHVETYTEQGFRTAEAILRSLSGSTEAEQRSGREFWSSRVELLYIRAHRIWKHRNLQKHKDPAINKELLAETFDLEASLNTFYEELKTSKFRSDTELEAGYRNALGTLLEAKAGLVPEQREQFGRAAQRAFEDARKDATYWFYATSNLARLLFEILKDNVQSRQLWGNILKARPDDQYAHYNLGLMSNVEGRLAEARQHFQQAPDIPEAVEELKKLSNSPRSTPEATG